MPGEPLRAVIFDFDGLILDTEWPEYQSWCEVYESYGQVLPVEKWCLTIGAGSGFGFDPYRDLERLIGKRLDREAIRARRRPRSLELCEALDILEGVDDRLSEARKLGLSTGLASSSAAEWVLGHLSRYDYAGNFDTIVCARDGIAPKPDPAVYLVALHALGVEPGEAIAFEDSPNGVKAAQGAGIYCVAVPNRLTSLLGLSAADAVAPSLAGISLSELAALRH
jgi:HAD superfamily hydrolase (TIGR01509 family)